MLIILSIVMRKDPNMTPSSFILLILVFKCLRTSFHHVKLHNSSFHIVPETAVAQWLRCCATNRKVAGSIPDVSGFFNDMKSFRSHCGPGVDSASNRNEYQEFFLGVKAAGA